MLGSPTGFLLLLSIPLKDVTTQFELYRVYAFPTDIGNKTYAHLHLVNAYFAVNVPQRTHLALSQNGLLWCKVHHELKICPADHPEFSHETNTCPLSLYLQIDTVNEICPRRMSMSPPPPTLLRQGSAILFHMAEARQAFFRCKREQKWESSTLTFNGFGLITGAAACHVTTEGAHLYPVLSAEIQFTSPTPRLYTPSLTVMKSGEELSALKSFAETPYFGTLATHVQAHQTEADIDTLFQIHTVKIGHHLESSWYITALVAVATVIILFIVFHLAHMYVGSIQLRRSQGNRQEPTARDVIEPETPSTTQPTPSNSEPETIEPTPQARFVKYSLSSTEANTREVKTVLRIKVIVKNNAGVFPPSDKTIIVG
jgi:hypothetical protein